MAAAEQHVAPATNLMDGLRAFLCDRYWLAIEEFPLCSDIFSALRLSGDDCHDFMENFADAFDVDLIDYQWARYHLAEEEAQDVRAMLRPLMRLAGLKKRPVNRDLLPISIDHLLKTCNDGVWSDPEMVETEKAALARNIVRFGARLRVGGLPRKLSR